MDKKAMLLCKVWNNILLNNKIEVCVDDLNGMGVTDVKLLKLAYLNPDYKIKQYLEVLKIPNSTLTNMVNRLTKKDLLKRKMDEMDLRSYGLELTEKDRTSIEKHFQAEEELFHELLSNLKEEEQEQFIQLFVKLVDEKAKEQ